MNQAGLLDPETSWWAKIRHAEAHRQRLKKLCDGYRASNPFHVEPEPTDQPNKTAFRLRVTQPPPLQIPLVVGDLLHNLRSALDSLMYELVTRAYGQPLSADEERACQFPIERNPGEFDKFFTRHKVRNRLTPPALRDKVIRPVQSFYWLEEAKRSGVESASTPDYEAAYQHSALGEFSYVSNIDKHRRLALTAWRSDLLWWGSNGQSNRRWLPGDGTFKNGSIIGYTVDNDDSDSDVMYDFKLTLPDLPAYADSGVEREDVVELAGRWAQATDSTIQHLIHYWTQLPSV
jgi:hypothetical protein